MTHPPRDVILSAAKDLWLPLARYGKRAILCGAQDDRRVGLFHGDLLHQPLYRRKKIALKTDECKHVLLALVRSAQEKTEVVCLYVVVESELQRSWAHADFDGLLAFHLHIMLKQVGGEDAAFQQECMVVFKSIQSLVKRARNGADFAQFLFRHVVQVAVNRAEAVFARLDLVADSIEAGHEERSERQVRIRRWIGRAELDTLGGWAIRQGNANCRAAVAFREDQVDGSFEARNQALVAVRGRCDNGKQSRRMG